MSLKIFEMMDAKARQDCIKEIDLLKVRIFTMTFSIFCFEKIIFRLASHLLFMANKASIAHIMILIPCVLLQARMPM